MNVTDYLATFDVIHPAELMAYFDLAPHVRPFILDMLAANGFRRRVDGNWRRAPRITLSSLSPSPVGRGGARTGGGDVPVEYRHRRKVQQQGEQASIWNGRHQMMMKS